MKNIRPFLIAALMLAVLAVASPPGEAAVITLNDRNSDLTIETSAADPGPGPAVVNWIVDGTDHMFQQWFWFRLGATGGESKVNTLPDLFIDGPFNTNGFFDPDPDVVTLTYHDPSLLAIEVRYSLQGGSIGSKSSDLGEQIGIYNLSGAPMTLSFFQYTDFDLGDTPDFDQGLMTNANTVRQFEGALYASETVSTPAPSRFEVSIFPATRDSLDDGDSSVFPNAAGTPTILSNQASAGPGNVTWAFQWDATLPTDGSFQVSKNKRIGVPEPATLLLFGTALIGAAARARRRRTQQVQA